MHSKLIKHLEIRRLLWYDNPNVFRRKAAMNYQEMIDTTNERNTFMRRNRIRVTGLERDRATVQAIVTQELMNLNGTVHGGVYFTMADACCGILARADGRNYVTTDTSFRFLKAASAGTMEAEATVVKRGKTLSFFRVIVRQKETGDVLADGAFTFFCTSEG